MRAAFTELILATRRLLLTGHEHPDGDCLGAEVALYHLLTELGKEVVVTNPDPISKSFDFLLEHTPIGTDEADAPLPEFDVAVLLDCSTLSRLGGLGAKLRSRGAKFAVIDHHVGSEDGDGDVFWVDSTAPATGALVYELFGHFGVPLSAAAAEGVFLSLVADTGWFRYSNTDARVLEIAAELTAHGVVPSRVYDLIHRRNHADSVAALVDGLKSARVELGGKFASACLDRDAVARAAAIGFDTDAILEPIRSIAGVEVAALLKERYDGGVKLSLRATRSVDVRAVAAHFGGGGHIKAAGASLEGPLEHARRAVRARVEQALTAVQQ